MNPLFYAAAVLLAWEAGFLGARAHLPRLRLPRTQVLGAFAGALLLLGAYVAGLALTLHQAEHDGVRPPWFTHLPFRFVDDAYPFGASHAMYSFAALGLAVVQTGALVVVLGAAAEEQRRRRVLAVLFGSFALLAACSTFAPVVTSGDVFGYVGLGMLGPSAYARPAGFFSGEYAALFAHYPIRPTIYGPVWVAVNALVVALGPTLWWKVVALRVFGAMLIVALAALAKAAGVPRAARWAILLNPMLWFQFVVNAHNDLLALVLCAAGFLAALRGRWWIAIALAAAAGGIKLPFLLLSVLAFAYAPTRVRAFAYAGAAAALALAVSALFGGAAYADALLHTARGRSLDWSLGAEIERFAAALVAPVLTIVALGTRRFSNIGGWFYPALAPLLFAWYAVWAVAYALTARRSVLETLLALPVIAVLADTVYGLDDIARAVAVLAVVAVGTTVLRARRAQVRPSS